jgi:hypothetical protein
LIKKQLKLKTTHINAFMQDFSWPKSSAMGKNTFAYRSDKKNKRDVHPTFSCAASDALGVFAVLQEFLMLQVINVAHRNNDRTVIAACASYFKLCSVIVLATMVPRGGVTATILMAAIIQHLTMHKDAYGDAHWVPKFHFTLHLPEQLEEWLMLIFCFTHERKHKEVKRYLEGRQNTSASYEKNIIQDVLHMQKLALREDFPYPRGTQLLSPRAGTPHINKLIKDNFPGCTEILRSVDAKANNFLHCHTDDVVYFVWDDALTVGRIILLCSVDGECMAFLRVWTRLPQNNMYNILGDSYFVLLSDLVDACVYKIHGDIAYVVPPRGAVLRDLIN